MSDKVKIMHISRQLILDTACAWLWCLDLWFLRENKTCFLPSFGFWVPPPFVSWVPRQRWNSIGFIGFSVHQTVSWFRNKWWVISVATIWSISQYNFNRHGALLYVVQNDNSRTGLQYRVHEMYPNTDPNGQAIGRLQCDFASSVWSRL